jgi:predicted RNase H-like HicB family nuclease
LATRAATTIGIMLGDLTNGLGRSVSLGADLRADQLAPGSAKERGYSVSEAPRYDAPMHYYTFEIVIEKEAEDEGYSVYSPSLPGCFSNGRTVEEAKQNIRGAIEQHLQSLLAHGQPIPQGEKRVHVEELTVGMP